MPMQGDIQEGGVTLQVRGAGYKGRLALSQEGHEVEHRIY